MTKQSLLDGIDDLPPVPAVAAQVMAMVADDRASAADLAQVIATDQALTAKLLRISNSAYYSFAREVDNVRDAVRLLGVRQVREVAVTMSLMDAFEGQGGDGFDVDQFWIHCIAVAVVAESVARRTRTAKPEDAYTAGILHDIGRLAILKAMPDRYEAVFREARTGARPLHELEEEVLDVSHTDLGRALGSHWNFPEHLVHAVASHHDESLSRDADGLAWVVMQANRLALHHGLCSGYELPPRDDLPPDLVPVEEDAGGIEEVLARASSFVAAAARPDEDMEHAA